MPEKIIEDPRQKIPVMVSATDKNLIRFHRQDFIKVTLKNFKKDYSGNILNGLKK